jgi:hypothetical protein
MADAPALDARAAHVIWDPAICPGVIPVKAERAKGRSGLRLDELPAAVTIVRDVSGTQHVLLQQGGQSPHDVILPTRSGRNGAQQQV